MSDVSEKTKAKRPIRKQRSIYRVHYCLQRREDDAMAKPLALPSDPLEIQAYGLQVAGHQNHTPDDKYLGLLQWNGKILKPILNESQKREVDFYTRVWSSTDPKLVELQKYVPRYYGCRKFTYNGFEQDYIILEDLTDRMLEPCIMDIKIGRRTWDPLATEEKIQKEQSKYKLCKEEFGFCIPGYQVYKIATGKLHKYNKEHGKKLHGQMVHAALRNYLNGGAAGAGGVGGVRRVCRALVLQQLCALWGVQRWAARAGALRLYASSLLLLYDAAQLRACCHAAAPQLKSHSPAVVRRASIHSAHAHAAAAGSTFSGQLSAKGPVYKKVNPVPLAPLTLTQTTAPVNSPWTEALEKLNLNHSFENNYEDNLCKIKINYRALLDQLSSDSPNPNPWGTVKVIDFAHAFFDDTGEASVDENFKEGVDNLVKIFESLLRETDDQVY